MARFRQFTSDDNNDSGIDMSPLMDCVFILLIFFIVTTTFVEEPGVEVEKPHAVSAERLEKTSILIALTQKGEIVYGGREIGFSGVQPLVRRMTQKEDVPVIVQADQNAQSSMLVHLIDEIKLAKNDVKVCVATQMVGK